MTSGFEDGTSRAVQGAFPSVGLGHRIVSHHYRLIAGEESHTCEVMSRYPPPSQGGGGAHRASGSRVFCHEADVRVLT
jgi:hypothetical protein